MAKITKTNAMRILDKNKIAYETISYDISDGQTDGISVALKIEKEINSVFKTLVTQGISKEYFVFVIPVDGELDLKKAALAVNEKKIDMIPMKELLNITGYIKGGCSPVGMKKTFKTLFHETAYKLEKIIVSGGKVGLQMELQVKDLIKITDAKVVNLIKE